MVCMKKEASILEKLYVQVKPTLFTIVVIFFHSVFTSDAHALAVVPDIASFARDQKFAWIFLIVTCK